jgi:hypothetical protein
MLCESLDVLKRDVAKHAATLLNQVIRAHNKMRKGNEKLADHWRGLPSACFACSALMLTTASRRQPSVPEGHHAGGRLQDRGECPGDGVAGIVRLMVGRTCPGTNA